MFAGILPERLWPSTGLTSATWLNQPVEVFEIGSLWATKTSIELPLLMGPERPPEDDDPLPHVVVWNGQNILEDGHHRVVRALLEYKTHILARWVEVS